MKQDAPTEEVVHRIAGASVLWADYQSLRLLFDDDPRVPRRPSDSQIDDWLLETFCVLSTPHLRPNPLHEPAPHTAGERSVSRPHDYNRCVVVDSERATFEVKGAGLPPDRVPSSGPYKTGLLHAPRAVAELFTERVIARLLSSTSDIHTVPTLAIILLPLYFPLSPRYPARLPAALLIRPHLHRHQYPGGFVPYGSTESECIFFAELTLRRFGLTSCDPDRMIELLDGDDGLVTRHAGIPLRDDNRAALIQCCQDLGLQPPVRFEVLNVQLAKHPGHSIPFLVDFEHYYQSRTFENSLVQVATQADRLIFDVLPVSAPEFVTAPAAFDEACDLLAFRDVNVELRSQATQAVLPFIGIHALALKLFARRRSLREYRAQVAAWVGFADVPSRTPFLPGWDRFSIVFE